LTSLVSLLGGLLLREPLFEYFETESSSEDDERAGPEGWHSGICDDEEDCEGEELPEDLIDDAIYGDFDMAPWKAFNKFYTRFDPSKKKSHRGALQKGFTNLLVRRMPGKSKKFWAICTNDRAVVVVDMSRKRTFRPRGESGWTYEPFRPLGPLEKIRIEALAAKLAARFGGDPEPSTKKKTDGRGKWDRGSKKGAGGSKKSKAPPKPGQTNSSWGVSLEKIRSTMDASASLTSMMWAYQKLGMFPVILLLTWRTFVWMDGVSTFATSYETAISTLDAVDDTLRWLLGWK